MLADTPICKNLPDHNLVQYTVLVLVMSSAVSAIFSLYDRWGGEHYIGENVTQLQHAQQVS